MQVRFAQTLSQLRHEKGVSQRQAAQALEVSQALLSHYENGIREPGLAFVVRACEITTRSRRTTCWGGGWNGRAAGPRAPRREWTRRCCGPQRRF